MMSWWRVNGDFLYPSPALFLHKNVDEILWRREGFAVKENSATAEPLGDGKAARALILNS